MAFSEVMRYEHSSGELRGIYDHIISTRGKLADVHTIQSLNPATILSHMNLYKDIMFGQSPLKRYQREMMAIVVSSANQCEYCLRHHSEALFHFWKDENKVNALIRQPDLADLNDEDTALCQFAWDMIVSPELFTQQRIDILKTKGLSDRSVLDAVLVVAYFNFVNRIVLGLGLAVETEEIKG